MNEIFWLGGTLWYEYIRLCRDIYLIFVIELPPFSLAGSIFYFLFVVKGIVKKCSNVAINSIQRIDGPLWGHPSKGTYGYTQISKRSSAMATH